MITGENIILRQFRETDIERMHVWVNDPYITKNLSFAVFPRTFEDSKRFLDMQLNRKNNEYINFVITEKDNDIYIGSCGLKNIDYINRKAEFNIAIGFKEYLGKGYGAEATKLTIEYAFNRLNLNKVYLKFIKFNEAARKAYEKSGFKFICEMEQDIYYNGEYYNQIYMEIINKK